MLVTKGISIGNLIRWTWFHVTVMLVLMTSVALLYHYEVLHFHIPWLPVSVIGTAVAFYVGFKNNQSYNRMWEARKIWGGIVNDSRTWGMQVDGFVTNQFTKESVADEEIRSIKKRLMYRHIAWLYAHRSQLLVATPWEHSSQSGLTGKTARYFQDQFGVGLIDDHISKEALEIFLPEDEYKRLINHKNTATQIINEQSRDLRDLRKRGLIEDFRHMQMMEVLRSFYALQGKNERIKKFPFPRQHANMSRYFVVIFILLFPFSMIPEFMKMGDWALGLSVPISALVAWIYWVMESVGDYTENPFQGMANDIPMLSLCRTIEIDMREMLGEQDLPPPIKAKKGILM